MTIKTAKEAIETANDALNLYHKELDQLVPWNGLKEEITKLDTATYAREKADQVGNVKTQLLNVIDEYDSATQTIYEWCGLSTTLLKTYANLFNGSDVAKEVMQTKFVANVLDHGIKKIQKTQGNLDECIVSFTKTSEHLTSLGNANLKGTVDKALIDTKQTKEKIIEKMQKMDELKTRVGESHADAVEENGAEHRQKAIEAAEHLIADCTQYRNNHAH